MRFSCLAFLALAAVGCSARDEPDAVSTTTLTSASLQPISLVGETRSGLRVNVEQSGRLDGDALTLARPAKLTLRRGDQALAFRVDGSSSRLRGAFEFTPAITIVTREALEDAHDGDPVRFVEAFSQATYGDPERVAPPALTPSWNALVLVSELGADGKPTKTTVEPIALRKIRR
jgi:hypothetical protein